MSSCSLCKNPFEKKQEVVKRNGNAFHRACIEQLLQPEPESNSEPENYKPSTTPQTTETSYDSSKKPTYNTQRTEQPWQCQSCGTENLTSTKRCDSCGKQRHRYSMSTNEPPDTSNLEEQHDNSSLYKSNQQTQHYDHGKSTKKSPYNDYDKDGSDSETDRNEYHYEKPKEDKIKQKHGDYNYGNPMSETDYEQPPPSYSNATSLKPVKQTQVHSSLPPSYPKRVHVLYIPDLPSDIVDNLELEQLIRRRIEDILDIKLSNVKCYSKLGIGVIQVTDSQPRDRLLKIGKLTLDPKDGKYFISFVDSVELVSYIVLDITEELKDDALPSTKEITRRWTDLHKGDEPSSCDSLNAQFPHIYRIKSTSLDKLINAAALDVFKIKTFLAHIYYCADCSFFEDLPRTITQNQLQNSIANAIGESDISSTSLYINMNKRGATACVIAADTARIWCTKSFISVDKHILSKKTTLSCRLLIHPVPKAISIQSIINHSEFNGAVTNYKQNGEQLIVELSDKNVFERVLDLGALRIGKQFLVNVDLCSNIINPEESEIDAETWYDTEMPKYTPDIMQFVANPEHPIFRYKWNPQIWLQQLGSTASPKVKQDNVRHALDNPKNSTGNQQRHQLRVTVMLNTLAAIRKRSYKIGDREVKLNLKKEIKTIVYDHESKLEQPEKMPLTKIPYSQTSIHVVREDCLIAYQNMVKSGKRPVLLNMASATSPGGGYRKGDGAQEENLFRRSDYCRSLDVGIDEFLQQQPDRLNCSSKCKLKSIPAKDNMYPMDEFGAIYTSGITVFRQPEDTGYAFMENPLEDVSAIAMAAYRDPELKGDMLAPKYAVGTRKKIENLFAIAYYNKHDSLILSAFGCGAFKNPPDHIVKIFQSVIEQYTGFFKSIVFAIVDDHNAGRQLNPEGNFQPFASVVGEGLFIQPITTIDRPNTMIGPYRLSIDGSAVRDVSIFDLAPCNYGAKCNEIYDAQHNSQFSHPPLCIRATVEGKCKLTNDPVHMSSFIHRNQCRNGGECSQINDEKHNREFEHPDYCSDGGRCQNQQEEHLKQYRHLPLCPKSHRCMDYQKGFKEHCNQYRHCVPRCPHGNYCAMFHNKTHLDELQHPFPPPCHHTPFDCSHYMNLTGSKNIRGLAETIQQHCLDFSHVCIWGRNCIDKNPLHWLKSIHVARHLCSYDNNCNKLNDEDHINSFTHSNIPDIRPQCSYADKCRDRRKVDHTIQFRHSILIEDGVVQYYGSNEGINFVQNQKDNVEQLNNYIEKHNWKPLPSGSVPREIINWIRTVQPIHRCSPIIFESILLHGHVMSREYMEHLKEPKFVANSVLNHSRIRRISVLKLKPYDDHAREYVTALINQEFEKQEFSSVSSAPLIPTSSSSTSLTSLAPISGTTDTSSTAKVYSKPDYYTSIIYKRENQLSGTLSESDMKALRTKTIEIAEACIKLHSDPAGIGYAPDKALGTDKLVFSVLGPHLGHYYGDIIIIFKRKILHHPDTNFSIQAATSFASGNAYKWRPWFGSDPGPGEERVKHYHRSKLNAAIPGYDYATALELMVVANNRLKSKTMDISLQQILDEWVKVDSHQNIEAHLPQLIPLDYIDHIYMPKNLFHELNEGARKAIDALFKHRITVVDHDGDAHQEKGPFGPTPSSKSRSEYQNFVVNELRDRYEQYASHSMSKPITGFVITIPGTNFEDHYILPLTLSQADAQYRIEHSNPSKDNIVYIYWKALNGDMMLTLSNEEIDPGEKQKNLRCLICYVAPKSTSNDSHYFEQTSYLTSGHPFQHAIIIDKKAYKAKSNTFYIGCDTNDYITYCLELHRSTGKAVLSHAGSNAIYNHEEISGIFSKSELDLNKLEFIHVSAGAHPVPIRNLMVSFEKLSDLHPTFDSTFNKNDSSASVDKPAPPLATDSSSSEHSAHGGTPLKAAHGGTPLKAAHGGTPLKAVNDSTPKPTGIFTKVVDYFLGSSASSLEPCRDNVNCLIQYSVNKSEHNAKYSHPCRFSELCREKEPHLTHEPHSVPMCSYDKKCSKLDDPSHRATYRHTELPDFLIPCRNQDKCHDKSKAHGITFSHGEEVYEIVEIAAPIKPKKKIQLESDDDDDDDDEDKRTPCKWGTQCFNHSTDHRKQYSHPSAAKPQVPKDDHKIPCKWGTQCHNDDSEHRAKYSHPSTGKSSHPSTPKSPHPSTPKSSLKKDDHTIPCKWKAKCHDHTSEHRAKYSHSD